MIRCTLFGHKFIAKQSTRKWDGKRGVWTTLKEWHPTDYCVRCGVKQ